MNVSFEVADVTRPLVAVGELQKRGMTVEMGPHESFVTRGHVTKPSGSNLDYGALEWCLLAVSDERGKRHEYCGPC